MTAFTTIGILLTAAFCANVVPAAAQEAGELDQLRQRALDLVNAARREAELPALSHGTVLVEAAQDHADDMRARDYYAHVTPDGRTPRDRFSAAGGERWAMSGENIAKCTGCSLPPDIARIEAFQDGWMQSPEHRENILSPGFDRFGFGIAGAAGEIYAVQTFAGPGQDEDAPALDGAQVRAAALDAVNARRADTGLAKLEPSEPLDAAAAKVLEARLSGAEMPGNIFGLLPEGATGWTSIEIRSGSRGGSGVALSQGDIASFVEDWASGEDGAMLGGASAGYLGFAASAGSDGRATAVALFGGRG